MDVPADEGEQQCEDEPDENGGEGDDQVAELTQVLTVTARKLANVTQGRKFSGQPKRSLQEKKKNSICAACGLKGHWAGDPECEASGPNDKSNPSSSSTATPKGKGRGQGQKGRDDAGQAKKVMTVHHSSGFDSTVEYLPHQELSHPHFTMMVCRVPNVCLISAACETAGYMIMDTACQRSCCGAEWIALQAKTLEPFRLKIYNEASHEQFQFGAGQPIVSTTKAWIPSAIEQRCLLFGVNVVETNIPFLGSLRLLKRLGAVIDLMQQVVFFSRLDVSAKLRRVGGHLAVEIIQFPPQPNRLRVWSQISERGFNDPEIASTFSLEHLLEDDSGTSATTSALPAIRDLSMTSCHDGQPAGQPGCEEAMATTFAEAPPVGHDSRAPPAASLTTWADTRGNLPELSRQQGCAAEASQAEATKCSSAPSDETPGDLHPPGISKIRQWPRELRSMCPVPSSMALGRNRLEVVWLLMQVVTASTIFINNSGWIDSTDELRGSAPSTTRFPTQAEERTKADPGIPINHQDWHDQIKSSFDDIFGSRTHGPQRNRDGGLRFPDAGGGCLVPGKRKRLIGDTKKIIKCLENEVLAMEALPPERDKTSSVDLLELYAGAAKATLLAKQYGLNALEPFDKNEGKDLSDPQQQQLVQQALQRFRPLLLLIGFPCTLWNLLNENCNYYYRMHELETMREEQRPLLRWTCEIIKEQANMGNYFIFESSLRCRIWDEPCVQELNDLPGALTVTADAGAFGATDRDGHPIIKPHKFIVNSSEIAQVLHRRLSAQERQVCKPLEGINVTLSQEYPDDMVRAILRALKKLARALSPNRFDLHQVCVAQPVDDAETWKKLLTEVQNVFAGSAVKALTLQPGQELYNKVEQMIPWQLTRVQIVMTPITRRLPKDVAFTHRGAALLHNDETITLEWEDLGNVTFPKQRFLKPVTTAIFFYGLADEDVPRRPAQPSEADEGIHLPVPGLRTDITFPNAPKTLPKEVKASVARLHINTGHCNKKELIRLLAAHGSINGPTLTAIEHMVCGSCERTKPPPAPRPAAIPHFMGQFGERVQLDVVYVRDLSSTNHPILGMVDMATSLQQAVRLHSRASAHVVDQFRRCWLVPYGYPLVCEVDADGAFEGEFRDRIQDAGVHLVVIPPEAHWRIGTVERRNAILRSVLERLIDENAVVNGDALDWVLLAAIQAVNSSTASKGRSPYQAVFGRLPRFPGDLMSDDRALAVSDNQLLAEELRSQALRVIDDMRASQIIRRALLRKTKPSKDEAKQILPGSLAAYWRWTKRSAGKKRGGYVIGRLLHHDRDNKSAWLQAGSTTVQVTYEQLRPAYGLESWTPSLTDIRALKNAEKSLADGLWQDHRGPGPPPDEPMEPELMPPADPEDVIMEPVPLLGEPPTPPLPVLPLQPQQPLHHPSQHEHLHYSPTFHQHLRQDIHQQQELHHHQHQHPQADMQVDDFDRQVRPKLDDDEVSVTEQQMFQQQLRFAMQNPQPSHLRHQPDSVPPHMTEPEMPVIPPEQSQPDATANNDNNDDAPMVLEPPVPSQPSSSRPPPLPPVSDGSLGSSQPTPPMTGSSPSNPSAIHSISSGALIASRLPKMWSHDWSYYSFVVTQVPEEPFCVIDRVKPDWDGNVKNISPSASCAFRVAAAKAESAEVSSDSSDDEETAPSLASMSRQERKALDREIPWRVIASGPDDIRDLYVQANKKEYDSWMSWGCIRPLSPELIQKIKTTPSLRKRVIPSRNAYRDKNRGAGPDIRAKCRTVVLGCQDPDLATLSRSSPTPTKIAEMVLLQIAAAGMNGLVELTGHKWHLWSGDVSTAFLQGEPEPRSQPLYMKAPRDGIQALAETFQDEMYEVIGNLYGFASAPRTWWQNVLKTAKAKDFDQHRYDKCMLIKRDQQRRLLVVMIVHVDDFLVTYREDYPIDELKAMFRWGSTTLLTPENEIVFRGKEIKMHLIQGKTVLKVTQKAFIDEMSAGQLARGRLQAEQLNPEEWKEFRSVAGSLQWLGGQTRPDVCSAVSLANKGAETSPKDLKTLFSYIDLAKQTSDLGLCFNPVPFNRASVLIGYGDSSWANAPGGKSQMGSLVLFASPDCFEHKTFVSILDWKSARSPRVTRSTLASEANAMDETVDRCTYLNFFITELLYDNAMTGKQRVERSLKQLQCTDCKSLYDSVISENPSSTEKRTLIVIRSIQDYINEDDCRWIPTNVMWADTLTKEDMQLCLTFQDWMKRPYVMLVDEKKTYQCEIHSSDQHVLLTHRVALRQPSMCADIPFTYQSDPLADPLRHIAEQ
jgi:hypothetical protein